MDVGLCDFRCFRVCFFGNVRVLLAHELLHEESPVLGSVEVRVGGVLAQVLFLVASLAICSVFRAVLKDVDFQFLSGHDFEVIHGLGGHFGLGVVGELHDGVSLVLASIWVLGELDRVDAAEGAEPLSDVLLAQSSEAAREAAYVHSVILLPLLVLVAWGQSISDLR